MGGGIVRHNKFEQRMSAMGQKQTLRGVRPMSALPPKADIGMECAPDGGQVQAAVLTDCWAWWSSYCTGLM